ncbi:MAG: DUF2065 domain-containing protein [Gammaproteobacteria bacterium]|nr:DUF2065 domain-containing protein [Gammaproteobacteria bacterium]
MWNDLLAALALVLVIEGLMPFLSPSRLRQTLQTMVQMDDRALRILGLLSMVSGVAMLYLVR